MKKTIVFLLTAAFILSTALFSFAATSEIDGFTHQTGTWTEVEGGVKATPAKTQHIVLDKTLKEGSFEVTIHSDFVKSSGIYFMGSKLDEVEITGTSANSGKHIESGQETDGVSGLSHYKIYFEGNMVILLNYYNGQYDWSRKQRVTVANVLQDEGAWKTDGKAVLKVEFTEAGVVKVYVEGTEMFTYTPAEGQIPTGDQLALHAVTNEATFTDIKVNGVLFNHTDTDTDNDVSSPSTGDGTVVFVLVTLISGACLVLPSLYRRKRAVR